MKQFHGILFHGMTMQREEPTAYDREGRRKYLTRDEGRAFIECARKLPSSHALFCMTIYYTGVRISEALGLRADDIDLDANAIRVRSLKKRVRQCYRRIPIPKVLVDALSASGTQAPQQKLWVFSRTTGWRIVKAAMEAAGIQGIHATTKGLRHAFGVRGAMEQVPVHVIQSWMGHASSNTTSIYLAVRDEEERLLIQRTWK